MTTGLQSFETRTSLFCSTNLSSAESLRGVSVSGEGQPRSRSSAARAVGGGIFSRLARIAFKDLAVARWAFAIDVIDAHGSLLSAPVSAERVEAVVVACLAKAGAPLKHSADASKNVSAGICVALMPIEIDEALRIDRRVRHFRSEVIGILPPNQRTARLHR